MPAQQNANTMMDSQYIAPVFREKQVKMIQERITQVEKQFGDLCQIFGSLSRKLSKMRDTGDKLAKAVADYATYERFNPTTKSSLKDFSFAYAAIQDFRDVEVKRLESKVIHPLSNYGELCKKTRESLKQANNALNKEMKQRKSLDAARERNPSNTQRLDAGPGGTQQVNMELERAAQDATMRTKQVEIEMDQFEKRKLADMKKVLMDYVNIEMIFHARSLECFTNAHNSLSLINEDEDLEEFRNSMRQSFSGGRLQPPMGAGSRTSLNTTGTDGQSSMSGTGRSSMTSKSGARRSAEPSPRKSGKASRDEDDDEEEEENEDEEESEEEDDEQDDEDNSDLDDYAKQLNHGRQSPQRNSGYGTSGARSSQASGRSSTLPPQSTPKKSILRPSSPKV